MEVVIERGFDDNHSPFCRWNIGDYSSKGKFLTIKDYSALVGFKLYHVSPAFLWGTEITFKDQVKIFNFKCILDIPNMSAAKIKKELRHRKKKICQWIETLPNDTIKFEV